MEWPIENGVVSSISSSLEMLLSVNATKWSIGYVAYPDILSRDIQGYEREPPPMANLCTLSTNTLCLHNLTLTQEISLNSFVNVTLNTTTNQVIFPVVNLSDHPNYWPFSGYSYYLINSTYYFPSGCSLFLENFQSYFEWVENSSTALSQANLFGYYLNQTFFSQLNTKPLSCYYLIRSSTPYSFVGVLLLIVILMSIFGVRYLLVHRGKLNHLKTFEEVNVKLEVSPLLWKAKIDSEDVILHDQIGSGSFGEVPFILLFKL